MIKLYKMIYTMIFIPYHNVDINDKTKSIQDHVHVANKKINGKILILPTISRFFIDHNMP
jgi:hypothetical protein